MLQGRDSAYPPDDAQLALFAAAGVRVYGGYVKFGNDGLLNGWTQADFDRVKAHGMTAIAFMSGWSDPATAKAVADAWGVLGCLDDETGIRADGSWVQAWLDASGFGLYGNGWVHNGRVAAFHILAGYPVEGNPAERSWNADYAPRPSTPCGWQWRGTHDELGLSVDSSTFDDWFAPHFGAAQSVAAKPPQGRWAMIHGHSDVEQGFVRGSDSSLWQVRLNPTTKQWEWRALGGGLTQDAIEGYANGQYLDIFVIGANGEIWLRHSDDAGETFAAYTKLGGVTPGILPPQFTGPHPTIAPPPKVDLSQIIAMEQAAKAQLDAMKLELDQVKLKTDKDLA